MLEAARTRDTSARRSTVMAWSLAAAVAFGAFDMTQVVVAIGGQPVVRLAALTASLYIALGLLAGAALSVLGARMLPAAMSSNPSLVGLAVAGWAVVVGGTYLNVVYLPSIASAVALAGNVGILAAGIGLWVSIARLPAARRVASSRVAALLVAASALAMTGWVARGWSRLPASGAHSTEHGGERARAAARPSVFVIAIDTLRADRTGAVGDAGSETPNLDALGAAGTTFARAYAQASWTKPSVASLFTSLYPSSHGANLRRDRLAREPLTIAELFRREGYRTAVFSSNPWISPAFGFDRGVDFFFESERESYSRLVMLLRMARALDRAIPGNLLNDGIRILETAYGLRGERRSNCERDLSIVEAFRRWLARPSDRPAFAYFHLMSPHIPYEPPGVALAFAREDQVALLQQTTPLPPERHRLLVSLYDGAVRHGDEVLGSLLEVLRTRGSLARSVIVVTADHGEEFFEHGRWGHGKSLYDEVVHVPLVLHGPGIPAGRRRSQTAMLVDIVPTLATLIGAPLDPAWEGRSLPAAEPGRAVYAELLREGGLEVEMMVREGHKYIEGSRGLGSQRRRELYDLTRDPGERHPLEVGRGWDERLAALREAARAKRFHAEQVGLDETAREKLRALGYLN